MSTTRSAAFWCSDSEKALDAVMELAAAYDCPIEFAHNVGKKLLALRNANKPKPCCDNGECECHSGFPPLYGEG